MKLASWKALSLSQAARVVLIQTAALSIPKYTMGTFLITKSICAKIDSLLVNFWWGPMKMHPIAWDSLCRPKSQGGLNFQWMYDRNQAILVSKVGRLSTAQTNLSHSHSVLNISTTSLY